MSATANQLAITTTDAFEEADSDGSKVVDVVVLHIGRSDCGSSIITVARDQ